MDSVGWGEDERIGVCPPLTDSKEDVMGSGVDGDEIIEKRCSYALPLSLSSP